MGTNLNIKGITRAGSSGSYEYAVSGDGQQPVTNVSWFDAARFTNWLHNPATAVAARSATKSFWASAGRVPGNR